jgi:hypothetical protein
VVRLLVRLLVNVKAPARRGRQLRRPQAPLGDLFFTIITRQAIRRGSSASVRDLTDAIRRFIDGWNERRRNPPLTRPAVKELQSRH